MTVQQVWMSDIADQIDAWTQGRLEELREIAEQEVIAWEQADRDLRRQTGKPAGKLMVRVRDLSGRSTPGAFAIDWLAYWYVTDKKGQRVFRTRYIPRGTGDRYPMSAFAGRVRVWQKGLVAETEARLARIRTEARKIAAVRTTYREAERTRERRRALQVA